MTVTLDLFRNETDGPTFAAGQRIFSTGDEADMMYVVLEGEVEISIRGKVVETLGPGGVFGEMALIERAPRIATATAATGCRLVAITEKRFLFMIQQTPNFSLQIMRVITDRLRRMDERL